MRCRVCGCTEENACNPPCGWAFANLCTNCSSVASAIAEWMDSAVRANFTGLIREARAIFADEALIASPPPKRRKAKR